MTDDANDALPGLKLFFAQGTCQVRQDEHSVGKTFLAKCRAPDFPSACASRKRRIKHPRTSVAEIVGKAELVSGLADGTLRR